MKKILPVFLILILAVSFSACASDEEASGSLFQKISAGLFQAEQEGNVQTALGSAEDHGITVEVRAAVAGSDKVTLQLGFSGVEEPDTIIFIDNLQAMKLFDEDGNCYTYNTDDTDLNSIRHIKAGSEIGEPFTETYEIDTKIDHPQNVRLEIGEICGVKGYWAIEFPLEYNGVYKYAVNETYVYDDELSIEIQTVTIDAYSTTIYYSVLSPKQSPSYIIDYQIDFFVGNRIVSGNMNGREYPPKRKGEGSSAIMSFSPIFPDSNIEMTFGWDSTHSRTFTIPIGESNRVSVSS